MSDDESSTLAMINSKKLMEMMPQESVKPDQDMMARMMKIFSMRQQGSDLLGNLLGISDQGMLNKMFSSSPDEAAKLLGVEK